jgi:hypothetical protein
MIHFSSSLTSETLRKKIESSSKTSPNLYNALSSTILLIEQVIQYFKTELSDSFKAGERHVMHAQKFIRGKHLEVSYLEVREGTYFRKR